MAKRRPNPLKGIPLTGKRSKNNRDAFDGFMNAAAKFFEALLRPALPRIEQLPGARLFRCSRCGFQMQFQFMAGVHEPKVCPMGCGKTFQEQTPGQAFPPKPKVQKMSRTEATQFILNYGAHFTGPGHAASIKEAYRYAAKRFHPDNKETGDHELFVKLQEAMEVLEG